jgi:large subunit ribosomal protein L25
MRDLPVECLPEDIPEHIDIDVSALDIGHSIHVRDLELAHNLKPTVDPDQTVVTCAPPTVAKEEAAPAAAEAVEGEEAAKKEEEKS